MDRPRFGVSLGEMTSGAELARAALALEQWGFDALYIADHVPGPRADPLTYLAWAAAVTTRLRLGTLVLANDFRNPILLAKHAATFDRLSGGRLLLGLGAGWSEADYRMLGLPFEPVGVRISRLEEAIAVMRRYWAGERFSFDGRFYCVLNVDPGPLPAVRGGPQVLIGGGGRRMMAISGREADIVSPISRLPAGGISSAYFAEMTRESAREKIAYARASADRAGRSAAALRVQSVVTYLAITDSASETRRVRSRLTDQTGLSEAQLCEAPNVLVGQPEFIRERIARDHDELGFTDWALIGGNRGFATVDLTTFQRFAIQVMELIR